MRSAKSGLLALAIAGFLGVAAVIGCSASGDSTTDDTSPTDPGTTPPNTLPPSNGSGTTDPPAPPKDAGKKDSSVDAGPPPPMPGDPCTKPDSFATRQCGKCGTQQAICQSKDGTDGGALAWSDYGPCGGEDTDPTACMPGTMGTCGNCGTFTCSKYCAPGACSEPPGACKAGSTDYTAAGCGANTYKSRSCSNTCTWSGYSVSCAPPNNPNKMTIPTSTGAAATSANWQLLATNVGDSLDTFSGCPGGVRTGNYAYQVIEVDNPTAQTATVSIQSGGAGSTADLDVIMWAYHKTLPPQNDTDLQACDYAPTDSCPTGSGITCPATSGYWGGQKGVTIPPNGAALVIISSWYATDDGFGTPTGTVNLQVKTTGLM
ncbi:MAG TPA: hypothetical protein VIF62_06730 [Labilithrix sp.]|jgi:hypothetical protein